MVQKRMEAARSALACQGRLSIPASAGCRFHFRIGGCLLTDVSGVGPRLCGEMRSGIANRPDTRVGVGARSLWIAFRRGCQNGVSRQTICLPASLCGQPSEEAQAWGRYVAGG